MKALIIIIFAALSFAPMGASQEVGIDERVLVSYDFDYEFFNKLGKKWRKANGFSDDQLVRINPRGLIGAGGLELRAGESFIHQNIGSKSIILFLATPSRHKQFRNIYSRIMRKQIKEISAKQLEILRAAN